MLDNQDICMLDVGWLRQQIAFVSQDVQMRNGTLADNLRIGNPKATDEELYSAIRDSGLMEYVEGLPEGLETNVGERGSMLSGGQKQRLSLARALVKDAKILILDEASSALDPITELKINEAIRNRQDTQTILIISHRLSTVLSADQIIVMENGTIIETGTHTDLLENKYGVYTRLFSREAEMGNQAVPI